MTVSTINPAIPAQNSSLASAPMRSQFQAAINDINNLYSLYSQIAPNVVVWTGNPVVIVNTERTTVIRFTSPAIANITLPIASFVGETHTIVDALGIAGSYNHVITPSAGLLGGQSSVTMTYNYQALTCQWDGTGWNILA